MVPYTPVRSVSLGKPIRQILRENKVRGRGGLLKSALDCKNLGVRDGDENGSLTRRSAMSKHLLRQPTTSIFLAPIEEHIVSM
jgi:hypothetical protein